jgi:hypothetical protein
MAGSPWNLYSIEGKHPMNKIKLGESTFTYFTKTDGLPPTIIEDTPVGNPIKLEQWREIIENNLSDIRVVVWMPPRKPALVPIPMYFLHWDNDIDLDALDEKVMQGTYSSDDFVHAILTTATAVACLKNYDWGADVLVPEHIFPDHSLKAVFDPHFFVRSEKGHFIRNCPKCGENLNRWIVKILRVRDKPQKPSDL